ncbi:hypothetical protein GMPD_37830 [Geomonas paludis]|uniref:Uncharacterized protein n=1 Tax=Geomonas paludis TaxID=2740185 RepID=A0A6V8N1C5_9BACT|nr:hypothetical protein GMPD_37830 [Geomonas paludis]
MAGPSKILPGDSFCPAAKRKGQSQRLAFFYGSFKPKVLHRRGDWLRQVPVPLGFGKGAGTEWSVPQEGQAPNGASPFLQLLLY